MTLISRGILVGIVGLAGLACSTSVFGFVQDDRYPKTILSPDHRYIVKVAKDNGALFLNIEILDRKSGKAIIRSSDAAFSFLSSFSYGVEVTWLPGGVNCIISGSQHISSNETTDYYGLDLRKKVKAAFVGWPIPHSHKAIVAEGDYNVTVDEEHVSGGRLYGVTGPKLYVTDIPSDFSKYRFATSRKKPLLFHGRKLSLGLVDLAKLPSVKVLRYDEGGYKLIGKFTIDISK